MTEETKTLFFTLLVQKGWKDYEVFQRHYREAARRLADAKGPQSLATAQLEKRQFNRWCNQGLSRPPRREARRILAELFPGIPVERLLGPAAVPAPVARPAECHPEDPFERAEDVVMEAAHESARFMTRAEATNVGPHAMEQLAADIRRIVRTYPNRPVGPLFQEVRELRNYIFRLLEGKQPPAYARDLYLAAGVTCGVLANASFDLGRYAAAETQARAAFLCGELAGHNGLRSWIRGLQALIAYWDGRPGEAVSLAEAGSSFMPEGGTAHIRLSAMKARALGQLGRAGDAVAALRQADDFREAAVDDDLPGGMMAFPPEKQLFYASSTYLWLGGQQHLDEAERNAQEAVAMFSAAPEGQRRLGEEALARMDLAIARLGKDQVDGAAEQVHHVLSTNARRHTESVTRRLGHFSRRLSEHQAATSPIAIGLREAITAQQQHLPALLPGDAS
ncbi:hypothetical protein [Streptomyces sp. NPDC049555]|uniref:hypothetical protein n=1 Tax=Streptomyces sp. NPDC049555 TaxID=3154930 RepID=UPI0034139B73